MPVPDYQTLMLPVLKCTEAGEVKNIEVVDKLAAEFNLTDEELAEVLPSGKQTRFSNRVNWAKSYLKQAGLVKATKWAHFVITERGKEVLSSDVDRIDVPFLEQFPEFLEFRARKAEEPKGGNETVAEGSRSDQSDTPDEALREAHERINAALASDLLFRVREASPAFFEQLIVDLLIAMRYGGTSEDAGRALGQSGDNGVDGVIDQDPLGVDQIYVQAKRYAADNSIGAGAIRDFFGALNLKRAQKGIFVTTSYFSASAKETASNLGMRIVLIDGERLSRLMIQYNIGCRDQDVLHLKKISEDFFGE